MQKNRVAVASVLKPVKDPRAYHRFGFSLRETNKYEINIIGFSTKIEPAEGELHFHTLFSSKRTSLKRLAVPFLFFHKIFQIRPRILIVSTYELLPVAILAKSLFGYSLIYDVQENHRLNISQNRTANGLGKWFVEELVQLIESCSRPFIDHFILAEDCYLGELPKFRPATVLENRFFQVGTPIQQFQLPADRPFRFLISGTITEVYGVLTAIQWFKQFRVFQPNTELYVIGYCPLDSYLKKLESELPAEGVNIELSTYPVPYEDILDAYGQADIVLMPYWQTDSIKDKIPSKLYEALALGKVCLYSPNPKWEKIVSNYGAGFAVDFADFSTIPISVAHLKSKKFYYKSPGQELTWKSQEAEFLELIESFIV